MSHPAKPSAEKSILPLLALVLGLAALAIGGGFVWFSLDDYDLASRNWERSSARLRALREAASKADLETLELGRSLDLQHLRDAKRRAFVSTLVTVAGLAVTIVAVAALVRRRRRQGAVTAKTRPSGA